MQLVAAAGPAVGIAPRPETVGSSARSARRSARSESRRASRIARSESGSSVAGSGSSNAIGRPVLISNSSNVVTARKGITTSLTTGIRTRPEITWRYGIQ